MSIFWARSSSLPNDIVQLMERFGHMMLSTSATSDDTWYIWGRIGELSSCVEANPEAFLTALARAVLPVGEWAVYGASCLLWKFFSSSENVQQNPSYKAIMDAALGFLRESGVPPMRLTGYEWQYWVEQGGTMDAWITPRPIPTLDEAPIIDLRPNETRRVVIMNEKWDSNELHVRRNDNGRYCVLINARKSEEDPGRVSNVWKSADSIHHLYAQIARALQVPPYWYDKELEPYFPLPTPKI